MSISVLIPTWKAASHLPQLIAQLQRQSLPPAEIIVIDSSSPDGSADIARERGCTVLVIPQAEFNHGGTRQQAAELATGDVLVFMTQDTLPVDEHFLANLVQPILDGEVVAAFARQIARADSSPPEQFARAFNYPAESYRKTNADLPRMGVKTYFFSDAASAVQRTAFWAMGGYPDWVIVNEDMVLCAKLLQAGHTIAYQAEAQVYHAHEHTLMQTFRRYFDTGVFFKQAAHVLVDAKSGGEGVRFAQQQIRYLWRERKWRWIPRVVIELPVKFIAFHLGKQSERLPLSWKRRLSGQTAYWNKTSSKS